MTKPEPEHGLGIIPAVRPHSLAGCQWRRDGGCRGLGPGISNTVTIRTWRPGRRLRSDMAAAASGTANELELELEFSSLVPSSGLAMQVGTERSFFHASQFAEGLFKRWKMGG